MTTAANRVKVGDANRYLSTLRPRACRQKWHHAGQGALQMSRLRLSIHPARQTGATAAGGAYGRPALPVRTFHECHRAAAGGFDAGGAVLDPHHGAHAGAKTDAPAGPSGGAGTGRDVAFSGKKTQKLWIWKAYDRTTGHL